MDLDRKFAESPKVSRGTKYSREAILSVYSNSTLSEASMDKLLDAPMTCIEEGCSIINAKEEQQISPSGHRERTQAVCEREESIKRIGRLLYRLSLDFHQTFHS